MRSLSREDSSQACACRQHGQAGEQRARAKGRLALPWGSSSGGRCSVLFELNPWEWRGRNRDRWAVAGEVLLMGKEVGYWVGGWSRVRFCSFCLCFKMRDGGLCSWDKPAERGCHSGCSLLEERRGHLGGEERGKHSLVTQWI